MKAFGDTPCRPRPSGHRRPPERPRHLAMGPARPQPPGLARHRCGAATRSCPVFAERVCLVGFSTGGSLALQLAAERPPGLAGVATVSAPSQVPQPQSRLRADRPRHQQADRMGLAAGRHHAVPRFMSPSIPTSTTATSRSAACSSCAASPMNWSGAFPTSPAPSPSSRAPKIASSTPAARSSYSTSSARPRNRCIWLPPQRHGILHEDIGDTQTLAIAFLKSLVPSRASVPTRNAIPVPAIERPRRTLTSRLRGARHQAGRIFGVLPTG